MCGRVVDIDAATKRVSSDAPPPALRARTQSTVAREATQELADMISGTWRCVRTDGLEPYLKHMGVGWAKRKIAVAYKPEASWALVAGVVQAMMVTPIGTRVEKFPFDQQGATMDPDGRSFNVENTWAAKPEGSSLVSTATDDANAGNVFVTSRHIDSATGQLVQVTEHDGLAFTRFYDRKH
jgi:hypothetical protein